MSGDRRAILRHFGADQLAMQGTMHAIQDARLQGQYVPPDEEVALLARPTPGFNEYFEFDRPVPSGIDPNARDLLAEDAMASPPQRSHEGSASISYDQPSPGSYSRTPYTTSPSASQPAGTQESPEASYQDRGVGSSGSGTPSSHYYDPRSSAQRRPYGAYARRSVSPTSDDSPGRSDGSPGRTPSSRSYDRGPPIQQPPFRAGAPVSGRVRRPGTTAQSGTRRRTTSSSPDRSRSASPSQPLSGETPASSSQQPSDPEADAAGPRSRRRAGGLAAKISGRPATAGPSRAGRGGGGAAGGRRPGSAAPAAGGQAGGAARPGSRVPAWAPAAGIANMRLDEHDEATRVALMLNDPAVRQNVGDASGGDAQQPAAVQSPPPGTSPQPPYPGDGSPAHAAEHTPRAVRASDVSEQYYNQYRLRRHREAQGVPDYRFAQPRSHGVYAPVPQRYFSFDEAHPAVAEQHFIRSPAQERMLQAERRKLQQERNRAARAAARNRLASPTPSSQQLVADVDRLAREREAGRARLRELEREGEVLRQETRQVQQRALDVIARSEQMTAIASRSPSVSPPRRRSRSPSPSAYYSGAGGGYGRGGFGPPGFGYYSRSPSASPGRYRPASASPGRAYSPASGAAYSGGGGGYQGASPAAQALQYQAAGYYGGDGAAAAAAAAQAEAAARAAAVRPVSAPPVPSGAAEAQQIIDMINSVERLPQHPQVPQDGRGADPAADPLLRASTIAASRRDMGLLGPDEQRIAMGAYDRSRYEEYQRQMDLEMRRRAVEDGYNSDLDRDQAAGELVHDAQKAAEEEEARRRAREESWHQQNEWMDEYRQRFGPEDGYYPAESTGGGQGSPLRPQHSAMSDAEEDMLQQPYVPVVSPELTLSPGGGYASEGPDSYHPHRRTARRLFFKSTIPVPFEFEEREKNRPKPISKVKLEQDLALRRAEEEAARTQRFRASPVPPAVVEPRYERMLIEAEAKRQANQKYRLEELANMLEKPFSFYYRDKEQEQEREALARAAKDPNRFQVSFRARDVPVSTKEERFRIMMLEMEARREATRRRVEEARRAAKERAVQEAEQRRAAADRAYQQRLRAVDPALHPYPPKPLGAVPDFNALHRQFEVHMARARANIRKRVTVPQEFKLNGTTPEEQAARARKAEERRHRIILDMQMDAELLPETRWPHKSPRGKVRRTPPPAYLLEWMARSPGPTHAASARKSSNTVAAKDGAYMTRAEREEVERKASEKLRAEALKRADRLLKAARKRREEEEEQRRLAGGGGEGGDGDFGLLSDVGATAAGGADQGSSAPGGRGGAVRRREAVSGRQDNPEVYVEARHAQIERRVHELVEDTLLDQGIEAFRYVEGLEGGKAEKKKATNREGLSPQASLDGS